MRRTILAGVLVVLTLAACGSGSTGGTATGSGSSKVSTVALVAGAADAAADARTAKLSGSMTIAISGEQLDVPIDGAVDFEHQAASLRVDMSKLGQGVMSGAMEMRIVDGSMYMNMGELLGARADALLGGKDWIGVDMSGLGADGGTQNPADMLQSLRGAGDVREVGHTTIDGTDTTHYRADIDVAKAMEKVPEKFRATAAAGMKVLGTSFPVDVWIDGDGLPRRFEIDIEIPGKGSVKESIDYTDFGADVSIDAPPADQVQSMADFQRAASGV
jgi:hypothetical protein